MGRKHLSCVASIDRTSVPDICRLTEARDSALDCVKGTGSFCADLQMRLAFYLGAVKPKGDLRRLAADVNQLFCRTFDTLERWEAALFQQQDLMDFIGLANHRADVAMGRYRTAHEAAGRVFASNASPARFLLTNNPDGEFPDLPDLCGLSVRDARRTSSKALAERIEQEAGFAQRLFDRLIEEPEQVRWLLELGTAIEKEADRATAMAVSTGTTQGGAGEGPGDALLAAIGLVAPDAGEALRIGRDTSLGGVKQRLTKLIEFDHAYGNGTYSKTELGTILGCSHQRVSKIFSELEKQAS